MVLSIDLSPGLEAKLLEHARPLRVSPEEYVKEMIAALPPAAPVEDKTLELLAKWKAEADGMSAEERATDEAEWGEIMQNIEQNRLTLRIPVIEADE